MKSIILNKPIERKDRQSDKKNRLNNIKSNARNRETLQTNISNVRKH